MEILIAMSASIKSVSNLYSCGDIHNFSDTGTKYKQLVFYLLMDLLKDGV